ncbi:MAG TPA: alpha-amylase family glycosyl hydrolase [Bacteroidales bacterium]|nr:alpha-amylase family glycosyl hydrolase [Bacteroidales bacterium]HRZ49517.1 alpha-amylase family glycosyl hydrolase [Bacteroidales bacterium]
MKRNIYIGILFLLSITSYGQVVTTVPVFPTDSDTVSVFFYADQGSQGLNNFTGDVYAHTGVITTASQSPSDWKYVKAAWGVNIPATKLTKVAANLYRLDIMPSIRAYYGVPAQEKILEMAFVFRSATEVGGSFLEGKTAGGGDIFIKVWEPGLQVSLVKPPYSYIINTPGDTVSIQAFSSLADSLMIMLNDSLIATTQNQGYQGIFVPQQPGSTLIKATACDATQCRTDSFWCITQGPVQVALPPPGVSPGINILNPSEAILVLYAPAKEYIYAIGDFNHWTPDSAGYMKRSPSGGLWWTHLRGLTPGKEYIYQYLVDGTVRIGDPYAEKVSDPWNDAWIGGPGILPYPTGKTSGIATVFSTTPPIYQWQNPAFTPPAAEDLVVYELLVRDFTTEHSFQTVIDTIGYLKTLGINAIELMPVNEFEGNSSWGYNPNYYFAVDKYYGTKNDLKALIDTCHSLGIAVILDVVFNHSFGTSPYVMLYWDQANNRPSAGSPFYNMTAKHDYNVGFDMNHESTATKVFIGRALKFWLEEFRVDGFRFDLSKGFTQKTTLGNVSAWGQYDASRIQILQQYADTIWSVNPGAYVILEHFANNDEEKELADRGMLLWGNLNYPFAEAAMGYHSSGKSDFSWLSWEQRGWNVPAAIGYAESHDEERVVYKCLQYGAKTSFYNTSKPDTAMQRAQMVAAFLLTMPGPKMIWQFGELGYDYSIDYNGRTGEKPVRWDYYNDPDRQQLYRTYASLNHLRNHLPAANDGQLSISLAESVKRHERTSPTVNMVVMGNFDVTWQDAEPAFPQTGTWYDYLSGDSISVTNDSLVLAMAPGEYHVWLDRKIESPFSIGSGWKSCASPGEGIGMLFPNPTSGQVTLVLTNNFPATAELLVQVSDLTGKQLASSTIQVSERKQIPLYNLDFKLLTGIYLLKITNLSDPESTQTLKLVVY